MPHGVPQGRPDSVGWGREAEIATWGATGTAKYSVGLGEGGWACHMGCHREGQIVWGCGRKAGLATWGAIGTATYWT